MKHYLMGETATIETNQTENTQNHDETNTNR